MYKEVPLNLKQPFLPSEVRAGKIRPKKITSIPQPITPVLLQYITHKNAKVAKLSEVKSFILTEN
jgi:hypothetical protein